MSRRHDPTELDGETAERLLSRPDPAAAPDRYRAVAAVLAAAAAPWTEAERVSPPGFAARLAVTAGEGKPPRRLRLPSFSLRSKVVVVVLAGALVSTGGLAAAGALPDPAQAVVQDVLGTVGIHVPGPNARAGNHPFERGRSGKTKHQVPGQSDVLGSPSPSDTGSPAELGPGRGRGRGLGSTKDGGS